MEVLAKTEYQDLYRVTDGVLLVVNKFVPIEYENEKYFTVHRRGVKQGKYNKGCQDWLKILKEDYYDEYRNITTHFQPIINQTGNMKLRQQVVR